MARPLEPLEPPPEEPPPEEPDAPLASEGFSACLPSAAAACPGINQQEGEGSPDVVYAFTPATTGDYTITYDPTFDGALYVVTDCGDIPNTCLEASEARSNNPPWDEVITLTLTAATTYYIIVDGGLAGGVAGTYTLDIQ